ncbi:TIGR02757 family protein [Hydrogenimonas cancrithermarum]|uniref:TIGR02757 family protein n=1 Tax=Hydrogenimonas cancrithermarum TaxID=2993563 RepID=A0ABM8FII1_9BACT|nr:TIGR02757 family protein [Hydrogenimonas cancrithermarum]BDY12083.1 TIGR02757 family protein [Hydrogenimonas cancrithermarum]
MNENVSIGLRDRLESEAAKRNDPAELIGGAADPLQVACGLEDARAILLCALFGYGNAQNIVKFLRSLDFSLLDSDEATIRKQLSNRYYRFQSTEDVIQVFLMLSRLGQGEMKETFLKGYEKERKVLDGIFSLIERFGMLNRYESRGYRFLVGSIPKNGKPTSPYKRWMMFLRWLVRKDTLDLGLWTEVSKADLVIPLDTHTFQVGRSLGLLKRKTYDWKAAVELTQALKRFCPEDPVKYDFALYRLGQEKNRVIRGVLKPD